MIINSVQNFQVNKQRLKDHNKYYSNPQYLNLKEGYNPKQISFCGLGSWLSKSVSKTADFFSNVKAAVEFVAEKVKLRVEIALGTIANKIIDNLYPYVTSLNESSQNKRVEEAGKAIGNIDNKIATIITHNPHNDPNEIINIYTNKLKRVIIDPTGEGKEIGLNKVIGLAKLKTDLYNDLLMPLCETMDGKPKQCFIPNGINFFGPKGTGKTYFAEQLGEHYIEKGGYYQYFKFSSSSAEDIKNLDNIFAEAEKRHKESGRKKYTILLFDELEKHLNKDNLSQKPTIARLLELTNNCKDKGVIFLSTSNALDQTEPALLRTGRTDLRIPIGHIAEYDLADIIKYYLKKDGLPHNEEKLNFQEIIDAVKTEKLQYKPKDVERRLLRESDNVYDYGGELNTESIKDALVLSKPEFDKTENDQFVLDKTYAKQLGGIYEYDK